HLFGLSFDTRAGQATRLFGEVAYRPNQPLSTNLADVADSLVARNPNSLLNRPASGKALLSLAPGATFDAYDRYKVTTATLGAGQGLPGALGASRYIVGLELGISYISGLPDPGTIRYGRSDAYGTAQVPGFACTDSYPGKTCALDCDLPRRVDRRRGHTVNICGARREGLLVRRHLPRGPDAVRPGAPHRLG